MRTEDERQKTEDLGQRTAGQSAVPCRLSSVLRKKILAIQDGIASLTFLDPACGSGNFLTETYICLRRLENRMIAALQQGQGELDLGLTVKVSIAQFHGIEINDFAVAVAKTALWIAEAQMLQKTAQILHREPDYLPLKDYDGIVEGNALRMDWPRADYIMGNPPFIGARNKSKEQAADMESVFGASWKGLGNLDYVTAWYKKATAFGSLCAFVSTNSICQGDGVAALWKPLFSRKAWKSISPTAPSAGIPRQQKRRTFIA
jgi:type I restriction-modification system DNA methylase subunit